MIEREDRLTRGLAWAAVAMLAAALAHQGFGRGAELSTLRAREAELSRRFDALNVAVAAEAERAGEERPGEPSSVPATLQVIDEIRRLRARIAAMEASWW